ncbi:hypothetical protein HDU67_007315 [Dinochytrium kinnereticum]|nr:hypothetical protein HDU67_007315 [Dinochytrium kinnereticum]
MRGVESNRFLTVSGLPDGKDRADLLDYVRAAYPGFLRIYFRGDGSSVLTFDTLKSATHALETMRRSTAIEANWTAPHDLPSAPLPSPTSTSKSKAPTQPPSGFPTPTSWMSCILKISRTDWGSLCAEELGKIMKCYGGVTSVRIFPDDVGALVERCLRIVREGCGRGEEEDEGTPRPASGRLIWDGEEGRDEDGEVALYASFASASFAEAAGEDLGKCTCLEAKVFEVEDFALLRGEEGTDALLMVFGFLTSLSTDESSSMGVTSSHSAEQSQHYGQKQQPSLNPSNPTAALSAFFDTLGFVHVGSLPDDLGMASIRRHFARLEGFRFLSFGPGDTLLLAFGSPQAAVIAADALMKTTRMDVRPLGVAEGMAVTQQQVYLPPPSLVTSLGGWTSAAASHRIAVITGRATVLGAVPGRTLPPSPLLLIRLEPWMNADRVIEMYGRREGLEAFLRIDFGALQQQQQQQQPSSSPTVTSALGMGVCLRFKDHECAVKAFEDLERSTDLAVEILPSSFLAGVDAAATPAPAVTSLTMPPFQGPTTQTLSAPASAGSSSSGIGFGMQGYNAAGQQGPYRVPSSESLNLMALGGPMPSPAGPSASNARMMMMMMGRSASTSSSVTLSNSVPTGNIMARTQPPGQSPSLPSSQQPLPLRSLPRKVPSVPCLPRLTGLISQQPPLSSGGWRGPMSAPLFPYSEGEDGDVPFFGAGGLMNGQMLHQQMGGKFGTGSAGFFGAQTGFEGGAMGNGYNIAAAVAAEQRVLPSRTIYVSGFGSMDKSDIKAMCRRFVGFVRIQFGQANFRVVLRDLECAKEAMKVILGANFVKASYARKEPEEKKIDELGEASKVLWTSTLYWSESELRKYLQTFEGFERLVFDASHSWIHFRDVDTARRALEDLNSTTNLYSVFSKKAERQGSTSSVGSGSGGVLPTLNSGGNGFGSMVTSASVPANGFGIHPITSQGFSTGQIGALGLNSAGGGAGSGYLHQQNASGFSASSDREVASMNASVGSYCDGVGNGEDAFFTSMIPPVIDGSLAGSNRYTSDNLFSLPRPLGGFPTSAAGTGGRQPVPSAQTARGLRKVASYSGLPSSASGNFSFAHASSLSFSIPAGPSTGGGSNVSSVQAIGGGGGGIAGVAPLGHSSAMGTVGVGSGSRSLFALARGVRVQNSMGAEHFPSRINGDVARRLSTPQIISNIIIIRNSAITDEGELRTILAKVEGFEDLLVQRSSNSAHVFVRFSGVDTARAVYEGYDLRETLGCGYGSVSFQYRVSGEIPGIWEPFLAILEEGRLESDVDVLDKKSSGSGKVLEESSSYPLDLRGPIPSSANMFSATADPWAKPPSNSNGPPSAGGLESVGSFWSEPSPTLVRGPTTPISSSTGGDPWASSSLPGSGPSSAAPVAPYATSLGSEGGWPAPLQSPSLSLSTGAEAGFVVRGSSSSSSGSSVSGPSTNVTTAAASLRRSSSFLYGGRTASSSATLSGIGQASGRLLDDIWSSAFSPTSSRTSSGGSVPNSQASSGSGLVRRSSTSRNGSAEQDSECVRSRLESSSSALSIASTASSSASQASAPALMDPSILPPRIDTGVDRWRTVSAPSFADDITSVGPRLSSFNPNVAAFVPSWGSSVSRDGGDVVEQETGEPRGIVGERSGSRHRGVANEENLRIMIPNAPSDPEILEASLKHQDREVRIGSAPESAVLTFPPVVTPLTPPVAKPVESCMSDNAEVDVGALATTLTNTYLSPTSPEGDDTGTSAKAESSLSASHSKGNDEEIGNERMGVDSLNTVTCMKPLRKLGHGVDAQKQLEWVESEMERIIIVLQGQRNRGFSSVDSHKALESSELISSASTSSSLTSISTIANDAACDGDASEGSDGDARVGFLMGRVWELVENLIQGGPVKA